METITSSELEAGILRIKVEIVEALHATEARILSRVDGAIANIDRRVTSVDRDCASCRADVHARIGELEQKHRQTSDGNGGGMKIIFSDPKFFTAFFVGLASFVWLLVERILPLLR